MNIHKYIYQLFYICLTLFILSCNSNRDKEVANPIYQSTNTLDYTGSPSSPTDRTSLAFSDQGAWFAFGFATPENKALGFTGPLLLTQGQGEWSSKMLSTLSLVDIGAKEDIAFEDFTISQTSFNSHLTQQLENNTLKIDQTLFFSSSHSAIINTQIINLSEDPLTIQPSWKGSIFPTELQIAREGNTISLTTERSNAKGIIQSFENDIARVVTTDSSYSIALNSLVIDAGKSKIIGSCSHVYLSRI